jgi:hypothetical protein
MLLPGNATLDELLPNLPIGLNMNLGKEFTSKAFCYRMDWRNLCHWPLTRIESGSKNGRLIASPAPKWQT